MKSCLTLKLSHDGCYEDYNCKLKFKFLFDQLTYYVNWHFAEPVKLEDFFLNLRGCLYIIVNEYDGFKITYSSTCRSEGVAYFYYKTITKINIMSLDYTLYQDNLYTSSTSMIVMNYMCQRNLEITDRDETVKN